MAVLVERLHDEWFRYVLKAILQESMEAICLFRIHGPQNDEVRTGWFDRIFEQAANRAEILGMVPWRPAAEMEVGEDHPDVRARPDSRRLSGEVNRQTCRAIPVEPLGQTLMDGASAFHPGA